MNEGREVARNFAFWPSAYGQTKSRLFSNQDGRCNKYGVKYIRTSLGNKKTLSILEEEEVFTAKFVLGGCVL